MKKLTLLIGLLFAAGAVALVWSSSQVEAPARLPAAPNYLGSPLATGDARIKPGLAHRRVCTWSVPGGNKYKGQPWQALQSMGLNTDDLNMRVTLGLSDDRAVITRYGVFIRGTGAVHPPVLRSMAFDKILCHSTFINFDEHTYEEADVYYAGNRTLIVPHVCNNFAELTPAQPVPGQPKSWPSNRAIQQWAQRYGQGALSGGRPGTNSQPTPTNTVPEPGTLWLVLAFAILYGWNRRRPTS